MPNLAGHTITIESICHPTEQGTGCHRIVQIHPSMRKEHDYMWLSSIQISIMIKLDIKKNKTILYNQHSNTHHHISYHKINVEMFTMCKFSLCSR